MGEKYTPDQPIVKGADVIYPPAGQAGEYAPLATNPYRAAGTGAGWTGSRCKARAIRLETMWRGRLASPCVTDRKGAQVAGIGLAPTSLRYQRSHDA